MNHVSGDTITIKVECLGCHKTVDYSLELPTAIVCDHCGMISEARLSLIKQGRMIHHHPAKVKRKKPKSR